MRDYCQSLQIEDSAFDNMRGDANQVLKTLIKNMVEKGSPQGSLTIKIDINLYQENSMWNGESRTFLVPAFQHKVNSVMQIKGEMKGTMLFEDMELVYDDVLKEYVLRPAARGAQSTIYDVDIDVCGQENNILQSEAVDFDKVSVDEGEDDYDYED